MVPCKNLVGEVGILTECPTCTGVIQGFAEFADFCILLRKDGIHFFLVVHIVVVTAIVGAIFILDGRIDDVLRG